MQAWPGKRGSRKQADQALGVTRGQKVAAARSLPAPRRIVSARLTLPEPAPAGRHRRGPDFARQPAPRGADAIGRAHEAAAVPAGLAVDAVEVKVAGHADMVRLAVARGLRQPRRKRFGGLRGGLGA